MKKTLLIILSLFTFELYGQIGYIKLNNDSIIVGYLRRYVSHMDGRQGIELWRTKKDKHPLKISKDAISEYAIKKDTFAILRNFYPFEGEDYQVESIEAEVLISKGKVKLYFATLPDYKNNLIMGPSATGGMTSYGQSLYSIYIVKNTENNLIGIKDEKDKLFKTIQSIIGDDKELVKRVENGELKYKDTEQIIRIYNKK